jgi:hypothetical protein
MTLRPGVDARDTHGRDGVVNLVGALAHDDGPFAPNSQSLAQAARNAIDPPKVGFVSEAR